MISATVLAHATRVRDIPANTAAAAPAAAVRTDVMQRTTVRGEALYMLQMASNPIGSVWLVTIRARALSLRSPWHVGRTSRQTHYDCYTATEPIERFSWLKGRINPRALLRAATNWRLSGKPWHSAVTSFRWSSHWPSRRMFVNLDQRKLQLMESHYSHFIGASAVTIAVPVRFTIVQLLQLLRQRLVAMNACTIIVHSTMIVLESGPCVACISNALCPDGFHNEYETF
jgi:hypothetical protein